MIFRRGGRTPPATTTYRLRERAVSAGGAYWIDDRLGRHAFRVDGKAFRLRRAYALKDVTGAELLRLQRKLLHLRETMLIEHDGRPVATVRKRLAALRDRFTVDLAAGGELHVRGHFPDHEYSITRDGSTAAEISKRWLNVSGTYGIAIAEGEDVPLLLGVAVCVDLLSRKG